MVAHGEADTRSECRGTSRGGCGEAAAADGRARARLLPPARGRGMDG
jgi:hypothetical protein